MLAAAAVMIMLLTAVTGYAFGDVEFLSVKTLDYEAYYYNNTYSFDFICKAGAGTEASKAWITEESRYDNGRLTAVTITVENPSGADRLNIHPFIAIYGEDRRLIELKDVGVKTLEKYTGAENDGSTVTERFELPENASYKVFLWDAENIMRPIKYIKW